jgi:hypothetical protein
VCHLSSNPYRSAKAHIEGGFVTILEDAEKGVMKVCKELFEKVLHDFNQVCLEAGDLSSLAPTRRAELGAKVKDAQAIVNGPVKDALISCGIKLEDSLPIRPKT